MSDNIRKIHAAAADAGIEALLQLALGLGATDAAVVAAADIAVDDALAGLCRRPGCENYGLGAGCPPHVGGPSAFRGMLNSYDRALVFKIDLPSEILFSSQRAEVFRLLHEIAAGIERQRFVQGTPNRGPLPVAHVKNSSARTISTAG